MAPILRQAPGEMAFSSGSYSLVGHYGEPAGFAVWVEKGERLPFVSAAVEGPLWFVLTGDTVQNVQAA